MAWARERALSGSGALRHLLDEAHRASARRGNISSEAVRMAAVGSGSLANAIAAALLTLGGTHGPLTETQRFLQLPDPVAAAGEIVRSGGKVPGWGNSFVKGRPDPLWEPVRERLADDSPALVATIDAVTEYLHGAGLGIHPNPSAWTAACAIALGVPAEACPYLFIAARLDVWTEIYLSALGIPVEVPA